jgi:hypothetical protein
MLHKAVVSQESQQHNNTIMRYKDTSIKYFICCWLQRLQQQALLIARMMAMCIPFYVVLLGATTMNDD